MTFTRIGEIWERARDEAEMSEGKQESRQAGQKRVEVRELEYPAQWIGNIVGLEQDSLKVVFDSEGFSRSPQRLSTFVSNSNRTQKPTSPYICGRSPVVRSVVSAM